MYQAFLSFFYVVIVCLLASDSLQRVFGEVWVKPSLMSQDTLLAQLSTTQGEITKLQGTVACQSNEISHMVCVVEK